MTLKTDDKKWLRSLFRENTRFDEPMSRHTSFRVGGPADAYVRPESTGALIRLVTWAREKGIPYTVVGDGTNLLVRDTGVRGLVIVLTRCLKAVTLSEADSETVRVTAGAGARLASLCRFAMGKRLAGMTFALGIPGTVGGAVMMNAGTGYGAMGDVLEAVTLLGPDGQVRRIPRTALRFGYRHFAWDDAADGPGPVILEGHFRLRKSHRTAAELEAEARSVLEARRKSQPTGLPSAGCFFRNPPTGEGAGALIDRAGLKGKTVGGAQVSARHANFIVNRDGASGADILALARRVKERVFSAFGVDLEQEVRVLG